LEARYQDEAPKDEIIQNAKQTSSHPITKIITKVPPLKGSPESLVTFLFAVSSIDIKNCEECMKNLKKKIPNAKIIVGCDDSLKCNEYKWVYTISNIYIAHQIFFFS
jgi:hypothetical protein